MAISTSDFAKQYWGYYIVLENDFRATTQYVTLHEDNFDTFSLEYIKLYQSICSEIDVIAKNLCCFLSESFTGAKINSYYPVITSEFVGFINRRINVLNKAITLSPWKDWNPSKPPDWWTSYNKVKHQRTGIDKITKKPYYTTACLKNVLNALAGLYQLELYFYHRLALQEHKRVCVPIPASMI